MIVRDNGDSFIMMTQHDHAQVSGRCAEVWCDSFFRGREMREAVELAIRQHDRGWIGQDEQPLWHVEKGAPYSFMDLPSAYKLSLYEKGIDEVEAMDAYAALLCSEHYVRFTARSSKQASQQFVKRERVRQARLQQKLGTAYIHDDFLFHYDLLAFCDNVSLYICLNEPGARGDQVHPFYLKGLPIPDTFTFFPGEYLDIRWLNNETISLVHFPFKNSFQIQIDQKIVSKNNIREKGLQAAFNEAKVEPLNIHICQANE